MNYKEFMTHLVNGEKLYHTGFDGYIYMDEEGIKSEAGTKLGDMWGEWSSCYWKVYDENEGLVQKIKKDVEELNSHGIEYAFYEVPKKVDTMFDLLKVLLAGKRVTDGIDRFYLDLNGDFYNYMDDNYCWEKLDSTAFPKDIEILND